MPAMKTKLLDNYGSLHEANRLEKNMRSDALEVGS